MLLALWRTNNVTASTYVVQINFPMSLLKRQFLIERIFYKTIINDSMSIGFRLDFVIGQRGIEIHRCGHTLSLCDVCAYSRTSSTVPNKRKEKWVSTRLNKRGTIVVHIAFQSRTVYLMSECISYRDVASFRKLRKNVRCVDTMICLLISFSFRLYFKLKPGLSAWTLNEIYFP